MINAFAERLVAERNFGKLDPDVMKQLKEDLAGRIEDRINATILENIPKEKLEQFSALLDNADSDEIQTFCQKNIANLDEVIAQVLVSFRETYLSP